MQFEHPRAVALLFGGVLAGMQAAFWLLPHADFSEKEKRVLAAPPAVSAASVADGSLFSQVESYIADHFAGRDGWVGVDVYLAQAEGRNAVGGVVRGRDGWLFPAPLADNTATLEKNMQAITDFAGAQDTPVYLMAVPSAGAVVQGKLPALHLDWPDANLLERARRMAGDRVRWLDVTGYFQASDAPDALYYRTDHHWTSAGAYQAYCLLMQEQGKASVPPETFDVKRVSGFYGTSYAKSGLWLTRPDEIALWSDPALHAVTTVYDGDGRAPVTQQGMLFEEYLEQADKYAVFLSGNHARVHIETDADSDKRLLVVKDSYAHALAPFLAEEYRTIDLIDLRYFKRQTISDWLAKNPADEILLVYGISSLMQDKNLQWLA